MKCPTHPNKCPKHPKYKAIQPPRCTCLPCWKIFLAKHLDFNGVIKEALPKPVKVWPVSWYSETLAVFDRQPSIADLRTLAEEGGYADLDIDDFCTEEITVRESTAL